LSPPKLSDFLVGFILGLKRLILNYFLVKLSGVYVGLLFVLFHLGRLTFYLHIWLSTKLAFNFALFLHLKIHLGHLVSAEFLHFKLHSLHCHHQY
jgi:ABC-type amino acid transport system permease subunit